MNRTFTLLTVGGLLATATTTAAAQAAGSGDPVKAPRSAAAVAGDSTAGGGRVPAGFVERRTQVGDIRLNAVVGGRGPTLVLLHGYPQNWTMWRKVLPALAEHYTVVAPELRGAGRSDAPRDGYDKKTLAADVHGLLTRLGLDRDVRVVGHDIGTMVAYAYAAAHPADVTRLVLSEAPIPDEGIYEFPALTPQGAGAWQFGFFSLTNGLPERTVDGREAEWVDGFTDSIEVVKSGIGPREIRDIATPLEDDARLRASFEYFRAFPTDIEDNAGYGRTKLAMPVLAIGASGSLGELVATNAERYAEDVTGAVVEDSGHWIFEERPEQTTRLVLDFLAGEQRR
ncbi:MAG: alpha/beta fold hydrolase [Dermatophilaceae bacterium]